MRRSLFRLAVAVFFLATACAGEEAPRPVETQPPAQTEPADLTITATDFDFALPTSVSAGAYDFTLINRGKQPHHAQFYRLAQGVSFEEFREAVLSNPEFRLDLPVDLVAGPPTAGVLANVAPGERDNERGELERGVYAVACSVRDIELGTGKGSGSAHHALGMVAEVQVT